MDQDSASNKSFSRLITYPRSWWALVFVLPFLRLLMNPLRKADWLEPNHITLFSFALGAIAAVLVLFDAPAGYVAAGILVFISYFLDCVDGLVARMKGKSSPLGAFLDNVLDRGRVVLISLALFWISISQHSDSLTGLLIMINLALFFWSITMDYEVKVLVGSRANQAPSSGGAEVKAGAVGAWMVERSGVVGRWMGFCYRLGIKPTLSEVEADMILFCVGLILVGFYGWGLLRPCLLISLFIYVMSVQAGYTYFFYRYFSSARLEGGS